MAGVAAALDGPRADALPLRLGSNRRVAMRTFLVACVVAVVIAAIGAVALNFIQEPVDVAFTSSSARI